MNEETTVTVNSDTLGEVSDKIENALTIMAEKLGVASDHFYPIVVEQQAIEGWIGIWLSVPIFIVALVLTLIALSEVKRNGSGIVFIMSIIAYIIGGVILSTTLGQILNPEYYALMEIKDFIK